MTPEEKRERRRLPARARSRRHYQNNKDEILAKQRQKRADPAAGEVIRKRERERRAANPEAARASVRNWYARNPRPKDEVRRQHLAHRHGMTPAGYQAMWDAQDGRCCYCERPLPENQRQVHIDHDHSCTCGPKNTCQSCRRGLACETCNTLIGRVGEDWERLERIAVNGRRLQAQARERINTKPVQGELPIDIKRAARRQEESA